MNLITNVSKKSNLLIKISHNSFIHYNFTNTLLDTLRKNHCECLGEPYDRRCIPKKTPRAVICPGSEAKDTKPELLVRETRFFVKVSVTG